MRIWSILFIYWIFFLFIFYVLNFVLYYYRFISKDLYEISLLVLVYLTVNTFLYSLVFWEYRKYYILEWVEFIHFLTKDINYIYFIIKKYLSWLFSNVYFWSINIIIILIIIILKYVFKVF